MSGRFDYVRYDAEAAAVQADFKAAFEAVEALIEDRLRLGGGRAKALALTNLEQTYMWIGKAIRDSQITRGGDSADRPERDAKIRAEVPELHDAQSCGCGTDSEGRAWACGNSSSSVNLSRDIATAGSKGAENVS